MSYRIGIDLGGTNIGIGMLDGQRRILAEDSIPTGIPCGPKELAARIAGQVSLLLKRQSVSSDQIEAAGIGIPGTVDPELGVVEYANNLDFVHVPFRDMLASYFPFSFHAVNDAKAAAWGEYIEGAGKGASSMVMLTLGTGVGGAVIFEGRILDGFRYGAGEFGHMVIEKNGRPCTCGRRGCLEAYASASALVSDGRREMERCRDSCLWQMTGHDIQRLNGKMIAQAAKEGDEAAVCAWNRLIGYLAEGTANVINMLQPEILCIGGGLSEAGEQLLEPLRKAVKPLIYSRESERTTTIRGAGLGNKAGVIGAAFYGEGV